MAQIIGIVIHKLKHCGRRKFWFPAILYNSTLTLKAFLGLLTFLRDCIVNVLKHFFFPFGNRTIFRCMNVLYLLHWFHPYRLVKTNGPNPSPFPNL